MSTTPCKKYAIYTAIVGFYDDILQPKSIHPEFDYIIFSNTIEKDTIGVWQIRKIPFDLQESTRLARWVKTHPEQLLPEYEFSIWMDANIQIITPFIYERAISLFESGNLISSMWHHMRDCIYEEAASIMVDKLEYETTVCSWLSFIKKHHYPYHNGLIETNVMFRVHRADLIKQLDKQWYSYISSYSKRDQLSFNYVLWEYDLQCPHFLPSGQNTSNSPHFMRRIHNRGSYLTPNRKQSPIMTYSLKLYTGTQILPKLIETYHHIAYSMFPYMSWKLYGIYYRILCFFKRAR